jgi:hypothetical protein
LLLKGGDAKDTSSQIYKTLSEQFCDVLANSVPTECLDILNGNFEFICEHLLIQLQHKLA